MPKPLVIDFDRGLDALNVDSLPGPKTWLDSMNLIRWAATQANYKTIAIDTIDTLEEQATTYVCAVAKKQTLADFPWGGGYDALAGEWRAMLAQLEAARERGISVCLLAHSVVRTAQDPTLGSYDQYTPQLQKKTWAATHRWADLVGFATFDAAKVGDERRAIVTGERVLCTTKGTGYEAKNRWSMPARLPLQWADVAAAMRTNPAQIREEVLALAGDKYGAKAKEFLADAGDDVGKLRMVLSAIREKVQNG